MQSIETVLGEFLDKVYDVTLSQAFEKSVSEGAGKLELKGTTDNLAKSGSKVIPHTPFSFY